MINMTTIPAKKGIHRKYIRLLRESRWLLLISLAPENQQELRHRLLITPNTSSNLDWQLVGIFADDISGITDSQQNPVQ